MSVPLDDDGDEGANVFSAHRIRARLAAGQYSVASFRDTLAWGRERLFSLFHDGASAETLVHARSHLVDEVLRAVWTRFLPDDPPGLALVAVGGYGRSELLPHSDIDILLLHQNDALQLHRTALEQFTAFGWDIGLEVGQSVRTIEDCAQEAAKDITVITNLLEARQLTGDPRLIQEMQAALTPDKVWPVRAFFEAKKAEQAARYRKYDDTGYKLEPNVKESPGGLRDIHTVAWVARRQFGSGTLTDLRERGFLTKQECDELFAGQDFLWRVRFALHMITGRREDRLLFDHQIKVGELFGYIDNDRNRAVEQFMQLYYRTIKSLSCLNDLLLQLFEEAILGSDELLQVSPLNARFQRRGQYIEAVDDEVFRRAPWALLEIFHLLQLHPKLEGIRAQTLRMILRDSRLLDDGVRRDVRARSLFIEMFREGRGLTRNLRRMNRYGVLGRYLPAFGKIVGLMQYDLFHTLTVDEHVLYVVRNTRRFIMQRFADELPFAHEVVKRLPKPELLYLGALFHDMAKGRGGDHSELGADEAKTFCLDHGLSHADADLVAWLVRQHLMMSLTAQKQDVSDPQVIATFAGKVGERSRLDYLFLLTCADIRATNPALWNSWRESLLTELYNTTARALDRGLSNPLREDELVAEVKAEARQLLVALGETVDGIDEVWARFDADYFLRHTPDELAWHFPALRAVSPASMPLVLVKTLPERGTSVFIYTLDRDHLFGLSTGVLARLGLNILDARLHTTHDGHVLDTYVVAETDNRPIDPGVRFPEITEQLRKVLSDPETSTVSVNRRVPHRLKHFDTPTRVHFRQDNTGRRTLLELVAADQPGLLSMIGRIFAKRGILVDAAKIATIGERAEDVFYIKDRLDRPITEERQLDELREVITRTLDRRDADA